MRAFFEGTVGLAVVLGFVAFSVFMIGAGWAGIENQFGAVWGWLAVIAGLLLRFTLPLAVGVFFCARDIWGLHWILALLIAAPGLAFMIPGLAAALVGAIKRR